MHLLLEVLAIQLVVLARPATRHLAKAILETPLARATLAVHHLELRTMLVEVCLEELGITYQIVMLLEPPTPTRVLVPLLLVEACLVELRIRPAPLVPINLLQEDCLEELVRVILLSLIHI